MPLDVGGHPGALLDAFALAGALTGEGGPPALVVAADHLVSHDERVCDTALGRRRGGLPGRRPRAASRAWAPRRAPAREVYDVWRLGTEAEAALPPRGALRRLRGDDRARRWRASSAATERPTSDYAAVCASQPHPQTLRGAGPGRAWAPSSSSAPASWARSATWARPRSGSPWRSGSTAPQPGDHLLALGYGGGEAIAQDIEVHRGPAGRSARPTRSPGEAIDLSTYYRWTRGRQAEPH